MIQLNALVALALLAQQPPQEPANEPSSSDAAQEPERGLQLRTDAATAGLTLYAPLRSTKTYLVDLDGKIVHEWQSDCSPGNSVYLQDNGDLIRCGRVSNERFHGGGQGGKVQRYSWDGELLWDLPLSNDELLAHHDIAVMPNGNLLVIAWEYRTPEEATAAGRDPKAVSEEGFWPDMVLELKVDEAGQATRVWEWHSFDHLVQDHEANASNHGSVADHPERIDINGDFRTDRPMSDAERKRQKELEEEMRKLGYAGDVDDEDEEGDDHDGGRQSSDWLHTNSIDYLPEHDLIMLSVRTFNEVWILDHSTTTEEARGSKGGRYGKGGDLLYRLGNPRISGRGEDSDQVLFRQHDASWIGSNDQGLRILVFNNGEGRPGGSRSTVDEFLLPFDKDQGFASAAPEHSWSYGMQEEEEFFASFVSGAQRLDSGNTLVCDGVSGRLFEVTAEGELAWEYLNPVLGDEPLEPGGGRGGPRGQRRGPRDGRGGPRDGGDRNGGDRDDRGPRGDRRGPPPGDRGGPPSGGPGGRGPGAGPRGERDGGPGGGPGGGGMLQHGLFRATRLPLNHPGLAGLRTEARD